MTLAEASAELDLIEAELSRRSLLAFTRYTFPRYEANWHHAVIARALDRVLAGEIRRLMLFIPPQNGKSELVSRRFPAYVLGKQPDRKIIACSYSDDLATDMSRDVQKIIDSDEYRVLFPQTRLATGRDLEARKSDHFEVVNRRGYYKSVGIMGSITGKTADLAIIDDPIKNRAEAESLAYRERVWDQFVSSFYSRQFGAEVPIVICQTRWHQDDLAGRLLSLAERDPGADQWTVLSLPAISEGPQPDDPRTVGEPLWPEKYPLVELQKRRAMSGEYNWSALYQQQPTPTEGGLIKRAWWQWYDPSTPPQHFSEIVISVDTALKAKESNDYSAAGVWGMSGPDAFGLKVIRGHWDYPELIRQLRDLHRWVTETWRNVHPMLLIENAGAGPDAVAELKLELSGVIAETPKGEKIQRVHAILPFIEAGNVWLPGRATPSGKVDSAMRELPSWVEPFVEECAAFPFGTHDDQVDQMTQALRRLHRPRRTYGLAELQGL